MANRWMLERYKDEVNGGSQDRAMRPALEANARALLQSINDGAFDSEDGWFAEDVKLILNLDSAGGILESVQEIKEYFNRDESGFIIVTNSILVDRGRIYCLVTTFTFVYAYGEKQEYYYEQKQNVILDLDKDYKYTRIEFRDASRKRIEYEGCYEDFKQCVRSRQDDAAEAAKEEDVE